MAICKYFISIFLSRDAEWLENLFVLGLVCILLDDSLVVCNLCLKITGGDVGVLGAEQALAHVNHYLAGQTVLPLPLS